MCEALTFLFDNIYIRFGTKLFRQIVGIPMVMNCAPLVADLFLFCYERDFMMSLSVENQSEIIEFYGDLVYKFRKICACNDFSTQFRKISLRYKKIGYNINVIRQTACRVGNPITVNNYASLFNCTPAG